MRVADLEGVWLDYWVAKAEGYPLSCDWNQGEHILIGTGAGDLGHFSPSTNWVDGGEIIEREGIDIAREGITGDRHWRAMVDHTVGVFEGETALIAAMRCYVASKFGADVPDSAIDAPPVVG